MAVVPPAGEKGGGDLNPHIETHSFTLETVKTQCIVLGSMGKTWSAHIKDDELNEKIEELIEGGSYHNQAHFWTEAAKKEIEAEEPDKLI